MHYANGKEAKEGDFVVCKENGSGSFPDRYKAGVIHSLSAQSETCNGRLTVNDGYLGISHHYVNVKDCIPAEDAYRCWESQHYEPVDPHDLEHVTGSLDAD